MRSKEPSPPRFKAVAPDYFVIFDPNSVIPAVEEAYPGKGAEFTRAWRVKQFEYGFLRSITDRRADFFKVTEDALACTAGAMKLDLPPEKRKRLLDAYLTLKPWPDAADALRKLKAPTMRVPAPWRRVVTWAGMPLSIMIPHNGSALAAARVFPPHLTDHPGQDHHPLILA